MILLNDVPIEDYGLFVEKGHSHPSPSFNNKTVSVPGRPGAYHFGSEISSRSHGIPIGVLEPTRSDTQHKLRSFLEVVLDENGKPKPLEMKYDYEPDKYYTVYVEGAINPMFEHEYANANMSLVAYDPWAYSNDSKQDQLLNAATIYINNDSYYNALPIIEIESLEGQVQAVDMGGEEEGNELDNPLLIDPTLTVNGKTIQFNGTIDNKIIINSNDYTIIDGNGTNLFGMMTGKFPQFKQGKNTISMSDSQDAVGNFKVTFRERWL